MSSKTKTSNNVQYSVVRMHVALNIIIKKSMSGSDIAALVESYKLPGYDYSYGKEETFQTKEEALQYFKSIQKDCEITDLSNYFKDIPWIELHEKTIGTNRVVLDEYVIDEFYPTYK